MAGERGPREEALSRLRDNAFYVLEVPITASRHDVERQGQKLLGMLELGLSSATRYPTPVGVGERDADKVRGALARLRDPDKRLEEELWGRLPAIAPPRDPSHVKDPGAAGADDPSHVKDPGSAGSAGADDPLHVKDPGSAGADDPSHVKDPGAGGSGRLFDLDDLDMKDLPRAPRGPRADRPWAEALAAFGWSRR